MTHFQVRNVRNFPGLPRGLGEAVGISATTHDGRHARAEPRLNDRLLFDALVLNGVMQQAGNRLVLITAEFQHQAGHAQQVRDVGRVRAFPQLLRVNGHGKRSRIDQPRPAAGFLFPTVQFRFSYLGSTPA
jgi:hypothetical protein